MNYVDDPTVAIVEINNENTLAGSSTDGTDFFNSLPEPFRSEGAGASPHSLLARITKQSGTNLADSQRR